MTEEFTDMRGGPLLEVKVELGAEQTKRTP